MRVLHLTAGELHHGAARGAYWLHRALLELGVDSSVLTDARDDLGDASVHLLCDVPRRRLARLAMPGVATAIQMLYPSRKAWTFSTGFEGIDFTKHPAYRAADLVHLHWVSGMVATRTLRRVDKPLVWTMRDMWPFTGGCHYAMDCERYRERCGQCPQLGSSSGHDLTRLVVHDKLRNIPAHCQFVGISDWLSRTAERSTVLRGRRIDTVLNGIDTRSEFFPVDRAAARLALGLDPDAPLVLVGAQNVEAYYKGFELLANALSSLARPDAGLLYFGRGARSPATKFPGAHRHLGFLSDTVSLRLAYSAADVFLAPSVQEAFGKTLVEAMACGTPVVCFDAGGPKEIVAHMETGYRATPFEPADLARGVRWVLDLSPGERALLRARTRERAVRLFDVRRAAAEYAAIYERSAGAFRGRGDGSGPLGGSPAGGVHERREA